jgi:DNA polymerase elongation subunit (family B)
MSYISAIRIKDEVIIWERTKDGRVSQRFRAPYYFYTKHHDGEFTTIYDEKVEKHEYQNARDFQKAREEAQSDGLELFESDIPPEIKILSEHYYNVPAPKLNTTFFDIEVDFSKEAGFSSVANPYAPINSVALYHQWSDEYVIICVPPTEFGLGNDADIVPEDFKTKLNAIAPVPDNTRIVFCKDERNLLMNFVLEIQDSDVICGWNSDFFDVPYVGKRLEKISKKVFRMLSFDEGNTPSYRDVENFTGQVNQTLDLSGRISADYMVLFRKYEQHERPSYKLESIAEEICPELPKLEYEGSLADLYRKNFVHFVRYNLRDTEVLGSFERKLGYVELANQMYHMSTGVYKHVIGTLKLADLATVNYCHHVLGGLIVNDIDSSEMDSSIQGAFVLNPKIGMHEWVGSVDINSLYPSAIRSLNISPETLRGQFIDLVRAAEEIAADSDIELALALENGETERYTATQWRDILIERKWAVSGYGTVFDQSKQGIIPRILQDWYNMRKEFQKKKKEADAAGNKELSEYYDRIQYTYKIKLNSFYGALTNRFFRFFDSRMGESTTGTGRMILRHQCSKINELLTGEYDSTGDAIVYGDSVANNTIIITENGEVKIEELFTDISFFSGEKEYCNVNNIKALTYDKVTNKTSFRPIKYVMRHKTNKKMFRIWITNSQFVDVTEDHSLIGYLNSKNRNTDNINDVLCEVKPSEIGKECHSLIYLKNIPHNNIISKNLPSHLYTLMGYVIGDGYVDTTLTGGTLLSLGNQDIEVITSSVVNPLKEDGWVSSFCIKPNKHDIQISSVKLRKFLREHLYKTGTKQIPDWMFTETKENICLFLRGLFSADGWTNKLGIIGITSIQEQHIRDIQRLLFLVGISSTWFTERSVNKFRGKSSGTYSKRLTIKNKDIFNSTIGFIQPRKNLSHNLGNTKLQLQKYDFELVNVQQIQEIQYNEYVYDIEVDDTHVFFANNILVHNTDSTYFKTYADNKENAINTANAVGKAINASYEDFMKKTFLCREGFPCIAAERELVSDRGIFVDKKRYILHICDASGKATDKMKIMGLDTKKTTMPKDVSKQLNLFIERLLKGETWEVLSKDIVAYKDKILTTPDIMSIGLPKGVQGVEEYTNNFNVYGAGTRLPGHVAASIFYNKCLIEFNDKESQPIKSGMKIKVFYLSQKYGKFKSIAIPVDIEQIPPWFTKVFQVDREAHLERLVDNPLQNIIKAIGREVPSKQSMLLDDLLSF